MVSKDVNRTSQDLLSLLTKPYFIFSFRLKIKTNFKQQNVFDLFRIKLSRPFKRMNLAEYLTRRITNSVENIFELPQSENHCSQNPI